MTRETVGPNLLLGIAGSINAMNIPMYLQYFRTSFVQHIKVIMTPHAAQIISPKVVELLVDDRVFVDLWDRSPSVERVPHIQLTQWADLFVVYPATANILGKAANGIADDLLSTAILSSAHPVIFVPAMNSAMWESKALQRNIRLLEQDGHSIVPPDAPTFAVGTHQADAVTSRIDVVLRHIQQVHLKRLHDARKGAQEQATLV